MLVYLIGLIMTPFKLIHMTFIVVSYRAKELKEGKHIYGQTGKDDRNDIQRNRQTYRLGQLSQTVVLGFCPCGPLSLNISKKKQKK
jgi:hypothetical protein